MNIEFVSVGNLFFNILLGVRISNEVLFYLRGEIGFVLIKGNLLF